MVPRPRAAPSFTAAAPVAAGAPLYRVVKRCLLAAFEHGTFAPGTALPSEAELARQFEVSIGTLRRAVDELVAEHILARRQGLGTFLASHTANRFLFQFFHVERNDGLREQPQVEFVSFERLRIGEAAAQALRVRPGEPGIQIENRLSLQGRAVVLDRLTLPWALFKGLSERRVRERPGTIYELYQSDFGITVVHAVERANAGAADRPTARLLRIAPGTPVIHVHRTALTFGDRPVEYRHSTIDTTRHDYVNLHSRTVPG